MESPECYGMYIHYCVIYTVLQKQPTVFYVDTYCSYDDGRRIFQVTAPARTHKIEMRFMHAMFAPSLNVGLHCGRCMASPNIQETPHNQSRVHKPCIQSPCTPRLMQLGLTAQTTIANFVAMLDRE